ncbi:MAG: hypothetical protein HYX76_06140 [Acidobacteria bacterium]|nr:hypothetical protein [Acidobacteriota bacterium]
MGLDRRGVQQIRTMARLVDGRRSRTAHGALLELSMLEMEKQRLLREMQRAERRCTEIRRRVADINVKEQRLHRFTENRGSAAPEQPLASPLPTYAVPTEKLRRRRLSY